MQTHTSNSQLALIDSLTSTTSNHDSDLYDKAWHILSLLLSIGHPTPPPELASRCTLFHATPDLICYLCSIPNSPITLTFSNDNYGGSFLVTISSLGLFALNRFLSGFKFIDAFVAQIGSAICVPRAFLKDVMRTYFRKRKRIGFDPGDECEKDLDVSPLPKRIQYVCEKEHFQLTEDTATAISGTNDKLSYVPVEFNNLILAPDLFAKTTASKLSCSIKDVEHIEDGANATNVEERKVDNRIVACELDEKSSLPIRMLDNQIISQEAKVNEIDLNSRTDVDATCCPEDLKWDSIAPVESESANGSCNGRNKCYMNTVRIEQKEELLMVSGKKAEEAKFFQPIDAPFISILPESDSKRINEVASLDKDPVTIQGKNQVSFSKSEHGESQKKSTDSSVKLNITAKVAIALRHQALPQPLERCKAANPLKENQQRKQEHMKISKAQNLKQKGNDVHTQEKGKDYTSIDLTDHVEPKDFPCFDSYVVEDEEGSGGYGTVYRARRKNDRAVVAIKCPHENAHRHHVSNELRMLERFGGKNFVIKYEGCFKNQNSDCFVLQYVEHDRPEVLKKEIDAVQLRWYGYCMFKALASLHKQGIVHRDVKPGNFLFSRKANKGYLIDFNLAMDLHQKYGTTNKLKTGNDISFNHGALSNAKYVPPTKNRRFLGATFLDAVDKEPIKGSKSTLDPKNVKKKAVRNIVNSQGADGSGITSVKEGTSTRTPSTERLREPLPCHGRKELINLLQDAMQSPNDEVSSVPAPMRKRIAAAPGKVDGRHIYLTPMPLNSSGSAVPGISVAKNKGDAKLKREGPCVGTKGFRAPEVLFRSLYQGPKVDIWSAGVTLLYLMIGKTPFYGDPEQNIKDIAKLKGSEDLWEVSKLHDRESSFPAGLCNMQSLPSMTLKEWCKQNTKRGDFLDVIPSSMIDLVDKCLTVNPRLRISAEDALKHEFFAPCHESLRKQRLLRQGRSLECGTKTPLRGQSIARPDKISSLQPRQS